MSLSKKSKSSASSTATSTSYTPRPEATSQEVELGNVGAEYYNDYMTRFAPLNQRLLDVTRARDGRDVQPAIGRANADIRLAMQGKGREAAQGAMRGVGRAGTGRGLQAGLDLARTKGTALADAEGGAYRAALDQEFTGLTKLAAQGRDIQNDALLSTAEAGNKATQAALARAGRNSSSSSSGSGTGPAGPNPWASTLASVAGAAGNALSDYLFSPSYDSANTGSGYGYSNSGGYITNLPVGGSAPSTGSSGGGFFTDLGNSISSGWNSIAGSFGSGGGYTPTSSGGSNWFLG